MFCFVWLWLVYYAGGGYLLVLFGLLLFICVVWFVCYACFCLLLFICVLFGVFVWGFVYSDINMVGIYCLFSRLFCCSWFC